MKLQPPTGLSSPRRLRRFYVETWGCQMNELDSQRMTGQLMLQGMLPTHAATDADLILLNSCSVREKAVQKVYSRLGEYRLLKRDRPHLQIGLCGCVAQQEGEEILARVADLDFVLGPARVGELADVLARRAGGERVVATGFPTDRRYDFDSISRDGLYKGMVTIIEGCNKRCTFCIVPSTRGPESCRSAAEIEREVRHLLDFGFVEIELLGQTVNHWREPSAQFDPSGTRPESADGEDFADLLGRLAVLPGLRRLRFMTSFPRDFSPRMVEQFRRHPNLCDGLHLPVQSGSDAVLRRMGRGYTIAPYLELVSSLRAARPTIALSTDIIVGFPGETEADFDATLDLLRAVRFAAVYAFCYSPRPGTAALKLADSGVPEPVAQQRLQRLFALQAEIQEELHAEFVGREIEVLVTGWAKAPGVLTGRTGCNRIVQFPAPESASATPGPGSLVRVAITRTHAHSLIGTFLLSVDSAPSGAPDATPEAAPRLRVIPA
ncbi:MAG: tRNA (N6-isopentenyl adenosine(37)-C2)-methylthiotransferase MiaB [Thermoanaerobaculia bacterium]|nr:tRNA (N6-isopentenyl adenosine(37)-C2)-methylthiotransferase MiaB [Thermoanaerobaculia bacterium]